MKISEKQREKLGVAWEASGELRDAFASGDIPRIRIATKDAREAWMHIRPKIKRTLAGRHSEFLAAHETTDAAIYAAALVIHREAQRSVTKGTQDNYIATGQRLKDRFLNIGRRNDGRKLMAPGAMNLIDLIARAERPNAFVQTLGHIMEQAGEYVAQHHRIV